MLSAPVGCLGDGLRVSRAQHYDQSPIYAPNEATKHAADSAEALLGGGLAFRMEVDPTAAEALDDVSRNSSDRPAHSRPGDWRVVVSRHRASGPGHAKDLLFKSHRGRDCPSPP